MAYNYQQALGKVNAGVGRNLSDDEINTAFQKFGGSKTDTFTDEGLNPVINYFKGQGAPAPPAAPGYQPAPTAPPAAPGATPPYLPTIGGPPAPGQIQPRGAIDPNNPGAPAPAPSPTAGPLPTGPVTSDADPRQYDPQHANDPEVLAWLNRAGGPGNPNAAPAPGGTGMESQIDALYKQFGIQDGGRGSGFADRAYWLEHPSEIANGRLAADLAGTGSDQPTGTPGTGPWSNSGKNAQPNVQQPNNPTLAAGGNVANDVSMNGVLGGGTATSTTTATNPYGGADVQQQIHDALLARLGQINGPIDQNSANIAEPLQAARDELSRTSDQERSALAERLYAGGNLNTQGVQQGIQQSSERNATGLSTLRAQLITREYDARRTDLNNMLQAATASGDAAAARAIQMQLAQLNAQVQREGLGVNLAEFGANLNQNAALSGLRG